MRHHRIRRGAAIAAVFAVAVLIAPLTPRPIEAQGGSSCECSSTARNAAARSARGGMS